MTASVIGKSHQDSQRSGERVIDALCPRDYSSVDTAERVVKQKLKNQDYF